MQISIAGLQHVGIPVTNIKLSEAFYHSLGFMKVMESSFEFKGGHGSCVMMKRESMMMELYQLPDSELPQIKNRSDGHIDQIAFDVPDIDQTFSALKNAGYAVVEEAPTLLNFWANGCRYFNIIGPDGERLEFNQVL